MGNFLARPVFPYYTFITLYFLPSQKFRVEVGTQTMDILIKTMQDDRTDTEIVGYALDTIFNILAAHLEPEEGMFVINLW